MAEYQAAVKECERHIKRIDKRCDELGIGHRFRPSLHPPHWSYGGEQLFKELRMERRRIAHLQIDEKLKKDVEEVERQSAAMQMEIISNGFVTEAARLFMAKLPTVDQLVPPLRVEELAALIEGKSLPAKTLTAQLNALTATEQSQLKEHNEPQ